jgi:phage terminase large subunit-like protein
MPAEGASQNWRARDERRAQRLSDLKRYEQLKLEGRLMFYKPYAKQLAFHALGKAKRERMLMAANRVGKTFSAASEVAFHLTGFYPDWWPGIRFDKPGRWGVGSKTAELTRDGAQKMLLGPFGRFGTGAIPKAAMIDYKLARGIPEAVDIFRVRHASGGVAEAVFKAYADGREKWQADEWQGAWLDEEAPEDIYSEASARTAVTSGPMLNTLTPLLGMSNVVRRFYPDQGHPDRGLVMMALDEAEHFDAEGRRKALESYLPHERDARTKGIPMLGEGAVYPIRGADHRRSDSRPGVVAGPHRDGLRLARSPDGRGQARMGPRHRLRPHRRSTSSRKKPSRCTRPA